MSVRLARDLRSRAARGPGLVCEPARLAVHVVLAGEAVLQTPAGVTTVRAGDVAAVGGTGSYSLAGRSGAPLVPGGAPTWYAALHDPVVAVALRAMHEDPAARATVASPARLAHVSRETLVQRFTSLVGVPPLTYLTSWRLRLAKERLRESDDPLDTIARGVGYGSGYAFATAFKRAAGQAPGAWRAAERASLRNTSTVATGGATVGPKHGLLNQSCIVSAARLDRCGHL